jgi:formate dehydrogenase/NADH-quinone oxidoreductase subunit F
LDEERRAHIVRLEEAMRKTSICGLGQVALGPVVSVLGLHKGGAAARSQPRPEGARDQPDR